MKMENNELKLKPKKEKTLISLLKNKRKRYLIISAIVAVLFVIIGFLAFSMYRDAKSIINVATGNVETKDEHNIASMNYVLRVDPTEIQSEYFAELKQAIEEDNADDETIAGLVVKNYVADFYTWSNKRGQYDVGGMYYVYTPQKKVIYTQVRDEFYKDINHYMNEYGVENLMEVESVEITDVSKSQIKYSIEESASEEKEETETVVKDYDAYYVSATWSYKQKEGSGFNTNRLATKMNYLVIKNGNRFEIVEANTNKIEIQEIEDEVEEDENEA